jgi:hypothetical protein
MHRIVSPRAALVLLSAATAVALSVVPSSPVASATAPVTVRIDRPTRCLRQPPCA